MNFQKFKDLYSHTLGEQPPSAEPLKALNDDLLLKCPETDIHFFLIHADQPNSWKADSTSYSEQKKHTCTFEQ